jgi:hypothetical protein
MQKQITFNHQYDMREVRRIMILGFFMRYGDGGFL